jgi:hypothetical protein
VNVPVVELPYSALHGTTLQSWLNGRYWDVFRPIIAARRLDLWLRHVPAGLLQSYCQPSSRRLVHGTRYVTSVAPSVVYNDVAHPAFPWGDAYD